MKLLSSIFLLNLLFIFSAFAHGENKYGPNGGYIKMPGAFHTELVQLEDASFRVYLLDFQNKNPTVKDSNVELQIKDSKKLTIFQCKPVDNLYFECRTNKKVSLKGQIILTAKRLGSQGKPAIYDLPLQLINDHQVLGL